MNSKHSVHHIGVDGMTVAFMGALPLQTLQKLAIHKGQAIECGDEVAIEIDGTRFNVRKSGGGRDQGYAYMLHTGRKGVVYQIKHSTDVAQWNMRARVSALFLAENGLEGAYGEIYGHLAKLNATVMEESVSNVDFAVDIMTDEAGTRAKDRFQLNPRHFVHHSRATKAEYYSRPENQKGDDLQVFGNRYVETVTIGGKGGRQLCVYNKKAEQKAKRRTDWFDIWGVDKDECPTIWRAEYRFGRDFLRDYNIKTIQDVIDCYPDLLRNSVQAIRLADGTANSRLVRCPDHSFWSAVRGAFKTLWEGNLAGIERGRRTIVEAKDQNAIYFSLFAGMNASMAVTQGVDIENQVELDAFLDSQVKALRRHFNDRFDRVKVGFRKTKERLIFDEPCGLFYPESEAV